MSSINTNPDNYQVIYTNLTTAEQAEYIATALDREIERLVRYCGREKQEMFILDSCFGISYRAMEIAVERGLVVECDGRLRLAVTEVVLTSPEVLAPEVLAPEAPAAKANIDKQIEQLASTGDPAYIQAANLYQDCLHGDWLDRLVAEIKIENDQIKQEEKEIIMDFELPNMKCKNLDRDDPYWFFVGDRQSAFFAVELLAQVGVYVGARPNGNTGCYQIKVPKIQIAEKLAA